jgi:hypothetical protein
VKLFSLYSFICLGGLNELLESHVGPSPHERMTKYIYSKFGNPFNVFIICPISILQIWLGENCCDTHLTIFFLKVIKVLFEFTRYLSIKIVQSGEPIHARSNSSIGKARSPTYSQTKLLGELFSTEMITKSSVLMMEPYKVLFIKKVTKLLAS